MIKKHNKTFSDKRDGDLLELSTTLKIKINKRSEVKNSEPNDQSSLIILINNLLGIPYECRNDLS